MHRIFAIPELLDKIFGPLDNEYNSVNVRVCRQWRDISQATLWRKLNSTALERLFGLLSALDWDDSTGIEKKVFRDTPRTSDWQTFHKLSNLVRVISFDGTSTDGLYDDLFKTYAITKPPLTNFFPNLHTLEWTDDSLRAIMENLSPFMLPNVRTLAVTIPIFDSQGQINAFFDLVASRIPGLRNLTLSCNDLNTMLAKGIHYALRGCNYQSLEKIEIPKYLATTELLELLSRLPQLVEITCPKRPALPTLSASQCINFNRDPELSEGAFPAISTLTLARTIPSTLRFLNGILPPTLRKICIEALIPESPASVRVLLERVAEIRPPLSGLLFSDVSALPRRDQPVIQPLSFDFLRPLTTFSNLKDIQIFHRKALDLTDPDIEELTSSLPLLEICILNNRSHNPVGSLVIPTLASLYAFARNCPNIQTLGFPFDARTHPQYAEAVPRFRTLKSLEVGGSLIAPGIPVAMFLSRILPAGCEIHAGDFLSDVKSFNLWTSVKDVLPSLISMRLDEEERTRCMLERVHSLEVEVALLRKLQD